MKKRLLIYLALAIPFGILTWYIYDIRFAPLLIGSWLVAGLGIAAYEIAQSGDPRRSALAVTVFWLASLVVYTSYWAAIIFSGQGGEQLSHFKVGASPDWLVTDLMFYRTTMLAYLLNRAPFVLVLGPLFGGAAGWLLTRSGLLNSRQLEKAL